MDWRDRLEDEDVSPKVFFEELLPQIHEERGADEFGDFSEVPVVVSFVLEGAGGGRWTVRFQEGDLDIAQGTLDEPPMLTVVTDVREWPMTRARIVSFLEEAEHLLDKGPRFFFKRQDQQQLQRFKGTITLKATGCDEGGAVRDLVAKVHLNAYNDDKAPAPGFAVVIAWTDYQKILKKQITPAKAFGDGLLRLEGDTALAMQLGSAAMRLRR